MHPLASPPSEAAGPVRGRSAWVPLPVADRLPRLALGLALPLAMAATPLWLRQGYSLGCGFRALTGLPCPLCGGTRACGALVQGDWAAAWAANPGAVVLLLWLGLCAAQAVAEGAAGWRRVRPWPWWQPWALRAVGGGLLLSWAARLAGWV